MVTSKWATTKLPCRLSTNVYGGDSGGSPENLTDSDRAPGRAERGGGAARRGLNPN